MENKHSEVTIWAPIALALLIVGGGAYFLIYPQTFSPTGTASTTPPVVANTYGMTQYTEPDLGFTFWYPSSWQVLGAATKDTESFPGGTLIKTLQVGTPGSVMIYVVTSAAQTITDEQNGHASPIAQTKYFYDPASRQWMVAYPEGTSSGTSGATTTADVSNTTMSGLIMLPSGRRFDTSIIPLSTTTFVVVSDGGGSNATVLAKTVSLAGAPVDPAILSATLQAEASAYASTQESSGTLQGNMTIGPICPVEQVGHPCNPTPQMYAAHQVFVYTSNRTKLITTLIPDAQGNFSATLPAGTYLIDVLHQGIGATTGVPTTVTIAPGKATPLSIAIDTGIR